MSLPLSQNQFALQAVQGMVDLRMDTMTIGVEIDASEAGTLVAGQSVKLVDSAGGVPKVTACASDNDTVFGFINYNIKNKSFKAGDLVEISTGYLQNVMYMTANGAIARGGIVMIVPASNKVAPAPGGSGKPISGLAFDKAAADGDLIRVWVTAPALFKA